MNLNRMLPVSVPSLDKGGGRRQEPICC